MSNCGQACPFNTLNGCKVAEYNAICPLTNMASPDAKTIQVERFAPKTQTNADRIRAMSDEELAWELMVWRFDAFAKAKGDEGTLPSSQKTILDWLKQPIDGGE